MSLGKASPAAGSASAARADPATEERGGAWQTGLVATATGLRLLLAPVVMGLLMAGLDVLAGVLFAVAALTDYLDGYLARRWRVSTATGSFLDTTADKVLVTAALIGLVAISRTSAWAALVIVGRELVIMGLRGSAAAQGVLIVASPLGRLKAATQFVAILLSVLNVGSLLGPMGIDQWAMLVAVLITLASGIDYLVRFAKVVISQGRAGTRV